MIFTSPSFNFLGAPLFPLSSFLLFPSCLMTYLRLYLNILATFVIKAVRSLRVRSILYLLRASMMFAIPSWSLSVFTIQTLWYTIFVQTINLLPSFSPFGALIFVRLRGGCLGAVGLDFMGFLGYDAVVGSFHKINTKSAVFSALAFTGVFCFAAFLDFLLLRGRMAAESFICAQDGQEACW